MSTYINDYLEVIRFTEQLEDFNFSLEMIAQAEADLTSFIARVESILPEFDGDYRKLAHDFWLTRNNHGAGFWDGDWGELGDKLTELSEEFGSKDVYVGDDDLCYFY